MVMIHSLGEELVYFEVRKWPSELMTSLEEIHLVRRPSTQNDFCIYWWNIFFLYLNMIMKHWNLVCSTNPPSGNQVEGLPLAPSLLLVAACLGEDELTVASAMSIRMAAVSLAQGSDSAHDRNFPAAEVIPLVPASLTEPLWCEALSSGVSVCNLRICILGDEYWEIRVVTRGFFHFNQ